MSNKTKSTLSAKRIITSSIIVILIPVSAYLLNMFIDFYELSLMFTLTIGGTMLIMYDWNLFAVHYNRSKYNPFDSLLYTLIGCVLIGAWTWIGQKFLQCDVMIPSGTMLIRYGYERPGMIFAYSFMFSSVISIGFKCLTDHLDVRSRETQAILISAIVGGIFFTAIFAHSFDPLLWIRDCLFNMIHIAILSYLYNQSSSFMPGLLATSFIHLAFMLISII